jgi:hypothetical protein
MKCSKLRSTFRPLVEYLESRLQPGSMMTGQGYGWSLLADRLSILDQTSPDAPVLVAPSSFEGRQPTATSTSANGPANTSLDIHRENLAIAVVSGTADHSSNLPANSLVDNLANNLVNNLSANLTNDLTSSSSVNASQPMVLAAAENPPIQQPGPATPMASVPQSPIGVAQPATPAAPVNPSAPVGGGVSLQRGAPLQAAGVTATEQHLTLPRITNVLHPAPVTLATTLPAPGGAASNQATINFLSYLGSAAGPDSVNYVLARNEGGTNFIYVAGSVTDSTGRTDAFAAKLAGDGTSVAWITQVPATTPGPDTATGLAVNGNNVYLVGSLADPTSTPQADGFVVELDANTGSPGAQFVSPGSSFAAVTTDSTGNVYIGGAVADPNTQGQVDILLVQASADLSTQNSNYGGAIALSLSNTTGANSSITKGGGVVLDSQGNLYFAGTVGNIGDPNNETFATYGRQSADGSTIDWAVFFPNVTAGPGGMGTAVALDPNSGNVVFTGDLNDNGSSTMSGDPQGNPTMLNQDLLLGRFLPAPQTDPQHQVVDETDWFVDDRSGNPNRSGDWTGNSLVVLSDGSSVVTGAASDPAAGTGTGNTTSVPTKGIDVHVTHFGADDISTTQNKDGDPENVFGGTGTDIGNGVALDPNSSASPYNVFVVGSTTSTDLPATSGVFSQTYSGTNPTGFVAQVSVV